MTTPLPARASVVIVGGGVIGTSIAFHLAEAGHRDVLLLERSALASGSTSRAAGGVRTQFSDELNIRIALRSIEAFAAFGERPGWEIDLHQVGYLFLLTTPEQVATFGQSIELQNSLGVPSRLLTPAEAGELNPLVRLDDVLAAAFCPLDGHATPEAVVQGYASAARSHGATLVTDCSVDSIELDDGEIRAVETSLGRVETDTVICAAGAWSRAIGEMAGVEIDVTPLRRQVLVSEPVPGLSRTLPMTIDFANGFYFHREGSALLMGVNFDEQPGFKLEYDEGWLPELAEAIEHRAPSLATIGVQTTWAGLYEVSPDHNALIGEAADASRFLYATGFSGHGFLQAPAVGEIVRDLVLGREPFVDVSALSADRFSRGDARPERNII
ncbi:MAG TPA: FAD-binding oxidoreductase [Gaiellales bacterium]